MKAYLSLLLLLLPALGRSDVMMESTMMMGMKSTSWTSGLKRRQEASMGANNPLAAFGGLAGNQITIQRVDKNVEWTIYPSFHVYTEKSLAIPYAKTPEMKSGPTTEGKAEKPDSIEVQKRPEPQTIAGLTSSGHDIIVNQKPQSIVWIAPKQSPIDQVMKEEEAFSSALWEKQYESWPLKEKMEMKLGMKLLGMMGKGMMNVFAGMKDWPEGMPVKMEMLKTPDNEMPGTFFELTKLGVDPVDASLFEIPAGFRKVTSDELTQLQTKEVMKGMGMGGQDFEKMQKEMEKMQKDLQKQMPQMNQKAED